jgi:hypothetical protein
MPHKLETKFRRKVRNELKKLCQAGRPIFFEPIQQKAIKGSPDFVLCVKGQFVALELKTNNGIVSKIQESKLQAISEAGGLAFIANPLNWPDVLKYLEGQINDCNRTQKDSKDIGDHPKTTIQTS